MLRRVSRSALTVHIGQSGLGKSSLLTAGLLPRLREVNHLPVYLRLDHQPDAPPSRNFTASDDGWGCLRSVVVLVEYIDPDQPAEIRDYDMCASLRR